MADSRYRETRPKPARSPLEKTIQANIIRYLRGQGAVVDNNVGTAFGQAGRLDLTVCWEGRYITIEVKRPGEQPTLLQRREIERVKAAGGVAIVAYSVGDVAALLECLARNNEGEAK